MGKFCTNCGAPVNGKFCANCGKPVEDNNAIDNAIQYELNGVSIDVISLVAECGTKGQIMFSKRVREISGASFKECVSFSSKIYHDEKLMQMVNQYNLDRDRKKKEIDADLSVKGVIHCPKCNSTSININKKGYGYGKGLIGTLLVGPLGLLAGGIGSKELKATCLSCGHEFSIKKK